jgi:hypothetical protein
LGAPLAAAAAVAALAFAPSAQATTTYTPYTWTGADTSGGLNSSPAPRWSVADNWSPAAEPSGNVDLTFPDLSSSGCDANPSSAACYGTPSLPLVDDAGPLTVGEISFPDGVVYNVAPLDNSDTITLDGDSTGPKGLPVGLSTSEPASTNAFPQFNVPIVLGGAQEWDIASGLYDYQVTGSSAALTLDLSTAGAYLLVGELATGPVTVDGSGELELYADAKSGGPYLPSSGVTLNDASTLNVAARNATSGPIDASNTTGALDITNAATPESTLDVSGGVTLGSTSTIGFEIDGNAASDASSLTATGTVSLAGAPIALSQSDDQGNCDSLTPGTSFTLLSAGTLTGPLTVNGQSITAGQSAAEPITNECGGTTANALISYGTNNTITATIQGSPANSGQTPAAPTPTPGTTTTTTTTSTTITPTVPSVIQIHSALNALAHPSGRKAIDALLKSGSFKTSFHAPSAGVLSIVWTTTVTVGTGKHKKHKTITIATATAHANGPGTLKETVRLTAAGRALLKKKPKGLSTKATAKFTLSGGEATTITKKFSL